MQVRERIETKVELAEHCRFRVGGPADWFFRAASPEELIAALAFARAESLRTFVYGAGSNLFFDDQGFRGLVIQYTDSRLAVDGERSLVTVGAGYPLPDLIRELATRGVGGLEFLANIPGSIGGAVVGNAGCYGMAIGEVVRGVTVLEREGGRVESLTPEDCAFTYRHSRFKEDPRHIVLEATLAVTPRDGSLVLREAEAELSQRRAKHPHDRECAGSFFKNPERESAWRLIAAAGLAGCRVGGAGLDEGHANFLVNLGGARSEDIKALVRRVQDRVETEAGCALVPEVRYIGPHGPETI